MLTQPATTAENERARNIGSEERSEKIYEKLFGAFLYSLFADRRFLGIFF